MPQWLPVLITIFAIILFLNAIGAFFSWRTTKNDLFYKMFLGWTANFINFILQGVFSESPELRLVGFTMYFYTSIFLCATLAQISEVEFNLKKYLYFSLILFPAVLICYYFCENYFRSSLLSAIFVAAPMLITGYKVLRIKNSELAIKLFAFVVLFNGFHFLDYPFLYDHPIGSLVGFSLAFLVSLFLTILVPTTLLVLSSKKYASKLEKLVEERTANLNDRTHALEQLNKENNMLLTLLSHDIASPLTVLSNLVLKEKMVLKENSIAVVDKEVLKTEQCIAKMTDILQTVKTMHATRLGKIEPQIKPTAVKPLIEDVISFYEGKLLEKNLKVTLIYKNNCEHASILADPMLFKNHVLSNIISNAIKFSNPESQIEIVIEKINATQLKIEIRDYGIGMSQELLEKVFDMNEKTNRKGTQNESGTGLGLPIVKLLIEKMSGEIFVDSFEKSSSTSETKNGTAFSLIFNHA